MLCWLFHSSDNPNKAGTTLLFRSDDSNATLTTLTKLSTQVLHQKRVQKKYRKCFVRMRDYQIEIFIQRIFANIPLKCIYFPNPSMLQYNPWLSYDGFFKALTTLMKLGWVCFSDLMTLMQLSRLWQSSLLKYGIIKGFRKSTGNVL